MVLRSLATSCQMHQEALTPSGKVWRDKAAIYRQHAIACWKHMGCPAPSKCVVCKAAARADKAMDPMDPMSAVVFAQCGNLAHVMCLVTRGL